MTPHDTCGTRHGIPTHAANGEPPCGTCLAADDARAIAHEARQPVPVPPSGALVDLGRVIALLAQALEDHDRAARRRMRDVHRSSTRVPQASAQARLSPQSLSRNASRTRPGEAA